MRALVSPNPGSARSRASRSAPVAALSQSAAVSPPYVGDDRRGQRLQPPRHAAGVAVHRRRRGAQRGELVRVESRDGRRVELVDAEPFRDLRRPGEGTFHRKLLVQEHAGEQGERVALEQRVGSGVARDRDRAGSTGRHGAYSSALTARTGHGASSRMRCAFEPRMSLPTGVRRRSPMTMKSASRLGRHGDQVLGRVHAAHQLADLVLDALAVQLGAAPRSSSRSCSTGVLVVQVRTAAVGVDHDQPGLDRSRASSAARRSAARPSARGT